MTRSGLPVSLPPDPNTRAPRWTVPPGACDTHAHVFGPPDIFPYYDQRRYTPPAAPVEHYRNMQRITGLSRAVFVCPTAHGYDNRVILDAIAKLGDSARGIANINSSFRGQVAASVGRGWNTRRALPSDEGPARQREPSERASSGVAEARLDSRPSCGSPGFHRA